MNIWLKVTEFLQDIFKPAAELIDELHTSDEEIAKIKAEIAKIESSVALKLVEYETRLVEAHSQVIEAEIKGGSWLQRNWRPILMLVFAILIILRWLGLSASGITEVIEIKLWEIIKIGMGGYVIGRSLEKVGDSVKGVIVTKKGVIESK